MTLNDLERLTKFLKQVNLYGAFIVVPHTQGAQVRITQCYQQITLYLPLPRKRSPDGASPLRLNRPGWLTYSGRFTHISSHRSAAGRIQDSESSPIKDRRSIPLCHATN